MSKERLERKRFVFVSGDSLRIRMTAVGQLRPAAGSLAVGRLQLAAQLLPPVGQSDVASGCRVLPVVDRDAVSQREAAPFRHTAQSCELARSASDLLAQAP